MMQRELKGKRILITGASSGIGREVAMASAAAGARLLLTSNQPAQLRLVADELAARTHAVIHVPGDITSPLDRSNIFAAAGEQFGGLDILINNAGVGGNALFLDEDPAVLRKIMEVNFFAVAECCRLGIPLLLRGEQPLIVNVSSMFGRRGVPNWSSYCASKFAVCGFSESLRAELAARMIDLMLVLPGVTRTEFGKNLLSGAPTNLASGLDAGRAAEAILSGIRQNRSEVRIGGDSKRLILLNRLFPRRLDRRMVHSARNVPEASGGNIAFSSAVAANGEKAINWRSLRARRVQSIRAAERLLPEPIFHAILFPFLSLKTLGRWRTDRKTLQMQRRLPESSTASANPA
jgi:short-subunit dehydrogenase